MNKIGIIVDGPGDLISINKKFDNKFKVLKTDGPRGHCAPIDKMISSSKKQISMLSALKCEKIILLMDYEQRAEPYHDIVKEIEQEIVKNEFRCTTVAILPNRMIENWYLADVESLSKNKVFIKDNLKQKKYEGTHGKDELKKIFKNEYSYSETQHGPQLFMCIRDDVAAKNSQSFKAFLDAVSS